MKKAIHILFTCAGRRNYLINYFKEALNGQGKVFACDKDSTASALKDANVALVVPQIYDKDYIPTLLDIIEQYKITAIISLNDLELPILAANRIALEKLGANLLISEESAIHVAYDKWETYKFLVNLKLKTALTFIDPDKAKNALKTGILQFPVIVKPRWGSASKYVDTAHNLEELELIYELQSLKIKNDIANQQEYNTKAKAIVIQEKLEGNEYGIDVLNDFDKNYCKTFARKKLSMRCGETDKAESVINKEIDAIGEVLGKGLKHIGIMDCDLFICNNEVYVLELNPRFGGGYPFSHASGANIAAMYIQWLKGFKEIEHLDNYKEGIIYSKYDQLMEIVNPSKIDWELEVEELNSTKGLKRYKKLLTTINCDNPFYKIRVSDALKNNHGNRSCYFVLKKNKQPVILMPFFLRNIEIDGEITPYYDVSSPYGYSGPSFSPDLPKRYLEVFWEKVDEWYLTNNVISEFIRFSLNDNHKMYTGTLIATLKNVRGKILNDIEQWNNLKPKGRNNYRKALQEKLYSKVYYENIPERIIEDFYDIYINTMIRNNADSRYFYELDFFKSVITENPENCAIALIYRDEKPISTELILVSKDTLYSFLGGTIKEFFYCRPNDFLKLEVIKWARIQKKLYYILGGGREDGDGLYKYKKSFFPYDEDIIYYTGRKIINETIYKELVMKRDITNIQVITNTIESNYFPLYRS